MRDPSTRYAISADASWLPDPRGTPPPADRQRANLYQRVLGRDFPAPWTDNRYLLSQQYVGTQYTAIQRTGNWLGGSTVVVECRREAVIGKARIRKASQSAGLGNDDRYHPADPDDELSQLFEDINPVDTFQDFIWKLVIQDMLTGYGHIWCPLSKDSGKPAAMWVLPSALLQPMFSYVNEYYPFGGYRLNPAYGMGWSGVGIPAMGNVLIPRQEVVVLRSPHPFIMSAGYGPTQALAKQIDQLNGVETSRTSTMAKGVKKEILVTLEGASPDQVADLSADLAKKWGGAENHGGVGVIGADKATVNELNQTPRDMDYPAGWEQSVRAVLAGYGVPSVVAGMIEANYAEFWAALRAWEATTIGPWATRFGARFTKDIAHPFYGREYRVRLVPPKINDPDLLMQQHSFTPNDLFTVNEHRAALDLPPMDGGDVVPSQMAAQQQAGMGLGPDGQPMQPAEAGAGEDMSGHPLSALGDSILEALGVRGGDGASEGDQFGDDDDQQDDDDSDPDTDVFQRAGKAFPVNRFEESKHKRDRGKFSSTGGAARGASEQNPSKTPSKTPSYARGAPGQPSPLPPQAARLPAVRQALQHLTNKAGEIAQRVNAAMLKAGLGPDELIGDQSSWERWFCTQYADSVAHAMGVDSQTAVAVLSHLIAHGVSAIKGHLKGKAQGSAQDAAPQAAVARRPGVGEDGPEGDRPVNRLAAGSLPPRLGKAFAAGDIRAQLAALRETVGASA